MAVRKTGDVGIEEEIEDWEDVEERVDNFSWTTLQESPSKASFLHFVWTIYWHSAVIVSMRKRELKYSYLYRNILAAANPK